MELKCSFWSVDSHCGAEGVGLRTCPLLSCTWDIELHVVSLGLGSKHGTTSSKVSEADLILNRAGKFDVPEDEKSGMTVCPRHRKNLTIDSIAWKWAMCCCHPSHNGQRKGNTQTWRVNAKMSQGIFELHIAIVPISSGSFYVNWLTAY